MIISFFGHSSFTKSYSDEEKILNLLEEKVGDNPADIYLGGYGDFDEFAYQCAKKYKSRHPNVSLIFITPYITEKYQLQKLSVLKQKYDDIIYPGLEGTPLKFAISRRNMWMVDQSDYIVCGIYHSWGGAYKAYCYAKRKKRYVYNITNAVV